MVVVGVCIMGGVIMGGEVVMVEGVAMGEVMDPLPAAARVDCFP